jgi:multisubunit Na+/H+ antiporter MnhC subunit
LVFALGAYIIIATYKVMPGAWLMATGVFCSIIAAGIQTKKSVSLTFIWPFDHNGVYHLVQALGLMFLLIGLRWSMLY